jgi:hypothetical protein
MNLGCTMGKYLDGYDGPLTRCDSIINLKEVASNTMEIPGPICQACIEVSPYRDDMIVYGPWQGHPTHSRGYLENPVGQHGVKRPAGTKWSDHC